MKVHIPVAVSLALAFAMPAFAQETAQQSPASSTSDESETSDSQPTTADHQDQAKHRHSTHRSATQGYSRAAMALTGDDRKTAEYQASDRQKTYPAVDHGHVPGDPPIIDHSGDQMTVAKPTATTITVPPTQP